MVKELVEQGVEVTVFTLHYPFVKSTYNWCGAKVVPLNGKNSFIVRKTVLFHRLLKAFTTIDREHKIAVIHSFWLNETTYWAEKLGRKFDIPVVATALGQDVLPVNRYLKKIKWNAVEIFCLSQYQKKHLEKALSQKIGVIPLGVVTTTTQLKTFDIVGVGNLIPLKNFSYLIALCRALKPIKPNFSAKLIGVGQELEKLKQLVQAYELNDNIQFLGELSYTETQTQIAQAKVLVHPSNFEGFGMILIEALANQTFVLSSPVGIAPELEAIAKLKMDVTKDLKVLIALLDRDVPPARLHSIQETVSAYIKLYHQLV
ncbi:MAG: glycosyltransferase family 4 protein [Flavobacteriales bacterium]|nr:glycosyltransferase family 4 protein [Flavobacteriales bacterium]